MGGVCGIGSIKGRLSPIESLSGTLSIPVGGILDCDIYDGEYTVTPSDTVQILPTANKLLKQDIVIEASRLQKQRPFQKMASLSLRTWFTVN